MDLGEIPDQKSQNELDKSLRLRESLRRGVFIDEFNQETNLVSRPIELPELTDERLWEIMQNIKDCNDVQVKYSKQFREQMEL